MEEPARSRSLAQGRYRLHDRIAAGGTASVYLGTVVGERGFSRVVAIKRLHSQYALDPEFTAMFLDEARLAARIRHPNVVPTLDVFSDGDELFLVMEYVEGASLAQILGQLRKRGELMDASIAASIMKGALDGLHAAHEAKGSGGAPMGVVHRDVSPQNVLVGVDGVTRVVDFGVAKAVGRQQTTREGQVKGKSAYMAPEQLRCRDVDRRTDVYAAGVVLWEALTTDRLFSADTQIGTMALVLEKNVPPPSAEVPHVPPALDAVVLRALDRDPARRFPTAEAMNEALEKAAPPASAREVGAWLQGVLGASLTKRADLVTAITRSSLVDAAPAEGAISEPELDLDAVSQRTSIPVAAARSVTRRPDLRVLSAGALLGVIVTVAASAMLSSRPRATVESASIVVASAASAPPALQEPAPPAEPETRPSTEETSPRATEVAAEAPAPKPTARPASPPSSPVHHGRRMAAPAHPPGSLPPAPKPTPTARESLYSRE